MAEAAPELVVATAPVVFSAVAMDGSGKPPAGSVAACEELASASLAEAAAVVVTGVGVAVAVAAAGAMTSAAAAAGSTVTFVAGADCAAVTAVSFWDVIAEAPLRFGRRSWWLGFECARDWKCGRQELGMAKVEEGPLRQLFNVGCAKIRAA